MYFALMGKLNARRKNLATQDTEKGFTLIELLVVVIIIGILAAIAIPVYLGVQNNAKNSSTQSDVSNLKTAIVSLQTSTGTLPTAFGPLDGSGTGVLPTTTDWKGAGATLNSNTKSLQWGADTKDGSSFTFCVIGTSTGGGTFYASDNSGASATVKCQIG